MKISRESADKALENRFFLPQQRIFDARDFETGRNDPGVFSDEQGDRIMELLYRRDMDGISAYIKTLSKELLQKGLTKNILILKVCLIAGRIPGLLYKLNAAPQDIEAEVAKLYSQPALFGSSDEIFAWLEALCRTSCGKLEETERTYYGLICDCALHYILKNFENSDLGLNDIADAVNLSPAYLSALYKKHTGQNITESVSNVRLETACYMLCHSSLSIKEIGDKTGYSNQYYFSSCFKKKMGVTPSEYRAMNARRPGVPDGREALTADRADLTENADGSAASPRRG
jgi:two-component system response regulator YesN